MKRRLNLSQFQAKNNESDVVLENRINEWLDKKGIQISSPNEKIQSDQDKIKQDALDEQQLRKYDDSPKDNLNINISSLLLKRQNLKFAQQLDHCNILQQQQQLNEQPKMHSVKNILLGNNDMEQNNEKDMARSLQEIQLKNIEDTIQTDFIQ